MKTIKILIEEPPYPETSLQDTRKKGRPKNTTKKVKVGHFGLGRLPHDLYLGLINLRGFEIDDFIRKYGALLPEQVNGSNFPTNDDIKKFQTELRSTNEGIDKFNSLHRNNWAHTLFLIRRKTNDLDLLINKYLKYCHLSLELQPLIQEELSPDQLLQYRGQIEGFTKDSTGLLSNDVLNCPKHGSNMVHLKIRCDNLYSWCVFNLVIDKLVNKNLVLGCPNCGRLFKAKRKNQLYCEDNDCKKESARKRRNKSYAKKVSRTKV